ncbi:MAG: PBP1A family penicillin-binding protein [Acidobacteriota bacterium]|nr:PBP1A family penicillin-binding protein [Acidobacteriota bacterium]
MSRSRSQRKRPTKRRRKRSTARRWFPLAVRVLLVAFVASLLLFVYLDVSLSRRFDGRLWRLPSRVFSDLGTVVVGEHYPPDQLLGRLERHGYTESTEKKLRAGQYRFQASTLTVRTRAFTTPVGGSDEMTVVAVFRGDRIASLRRDDGATLPRWLLEPVPLAAFYGAHQEEREIRTLDEFPPRLIDAVLAAEDSRFRRHHGLDLRGIGRAAVTNVRRGGIVQGGSTITQQTVKNLFLTPRRSWWRKAREAAMALVLDAHYSKDRILEVYLNEVYLGQRGAISVCGFQAASRHYFGRDVDRLSVAEAATLAGLIRSPGRYDPLREPESALERRDQVLDALLQLEWITPEQHGVAKAETLQAAGRGDGNTRAPYAVEYIRQRLAERYSRKTLEEEGLSIYTTLDTRIQQATEQALAGGLGRLEERAPGLQGAVVVTEPARGAVVAMVGGRDFGSSQFNRAVQARRQPGSCFKPFVFAAGLELQRNGLPGGLKPGTKLEDRPIRWTSGGKSWAPSNYDHKFRGKVTVRRALVDSLNVPTVRAARRIGMEEVVRTARRCGLQSPMKPLPSLALGTAEVSPLELATAYGTLANGGRRIDPWLIQAVQNQKGELLEGRSPRAQRAITEQTARQLTDMLRGVLRDGTAKTASALGYRGVAAGKTGTTDETRDAWFVGYDRRRLALVWVGYDDNRRTGLTGASGALPIWVELMKTFDDGGGVAADAPETVTVFIDPTTGQRAVRRCPERVEQTFPRGEVPERCREHQGRMRRWMRGLLGGNN